MVPRRGYFLMLFADCILQIGFNASWLHWADRWKSFCQRFLTISSVPRDRTALGLSALSSHLMSLVSVHRSRLPNTMIVVTSANRKENVSWILDLEKFFRSKTKLLLSLSLSFHDALKNGHREMSRSSLYYKGKKTSYPIKIWKTSSVNVTSYTR